MSASIDAADAALEAAAKAIAAARTVLAAAKEAKPAAAALRDLPHNMTRKQAKEMLALEVRVYDRVAREFGRRPGRDWIVPTVRLIEAIEASKRHAAEKAAAEPEAEENAPLSFAGFASRMRKKAG